MKEAENSSMISDELLDEYRRSGTLIRVVRDNSEANDVIGYVVAWSGEEVLIRKANRRVLKLSRRYRIQPFDEERLEPY